MNLLNVEAIFGFLEAKYILNKISVLLTFTLKELIDMAHINFKQMFCKHEWEIVDSYRFSERCKDGHKKECFSCIKKCSKCGKVKDFFESTK